jgi:hypothetical protein
MPCIWSNFRISLAALVTIAIVSPAPAKADFADELFVKLKSLSFLGINPDHVEMARYSVYHPENAGIIYDHASKWDYPFFALVAAAKASKGQDLPGIGVFDEAKCIFPITAIDAVFAESSNYIDDTAGKAETDGVVEAAKQKAVEYAQSQNQAAKEEVLKQLSENVPYFKEIPVICHFAFNSEFKAEKNLQELVGDTTNNLRAAYAEFKSGDILDGVDKLIAAGIGASLACELVDSAVAGGAIGNTPVLGDLAKGACKSFAGTIIKGVSAVTGALLDLSEEIASGAVDLAGDGACLVVSLFGGCETAPPAPPPSGINSATAFCAPYGGIKSAMSKTHAPDDYSVICNDGSRCIAKPGTPPQCISGAEIAAQAAKREADRIASINAGIVLWAKLFVKTWFDQCEDDICHDDIIKLHNDGVTHARVRRDTTTFLWGMIEQELKPYDQQAVAAIEASQSRSAAFNQETTEGAASAWRKIMEAYWSKKCWDEECHTEVYYLAEEMEEALIATQASNPDASSLSIQGKVGSSYAPRFEAAIAQSNKRRILANPNATAEEKLPLLGCKYFLGRQEQWLCTADIQGFAACNDYVKAGAAQLCITPAGPAYFGTTEIADVMLVGQGCVASKKTAFTYTCPKKDGADSCKRFQAGGMPVGCNNEIVIELKPPPPPTTASRLADLGCKLFLGRQGQWLCAAAHGYDSCVGFVRRADPAAVFCASPEGKQYGTAPVIVTMLSSQKCIQKSPGELSFACPEEAGRDSCLRFRKGGVSIACDGRMPQIALIPGPAAGRDPTTLVKPGQGQGNGTIVLLGRPPAGVAGQGPATGLAELGCRRGSRRGEWACGTAPGFTACVNLVRRNEAILCLGKNGVRFGTLPVATAMLNEQGCLPANRGMAGAFACSTPNGSMLCEGFRAGGMQFTCTSAQATPLRVVPQLQLIEQPPVIRLLPQAR